MANRPCKPDADVKRIWQWLLPDAAFPACGTKTNAAAGDNGAPGNEITDSDAAHGAKQIARRDRSGV